MPESLANKLENCHDMSSEKVEKELRVRKYNFANQYGRTKSRGTIIELFPRNEAKNNADNWQQKCAKFSSN